MKGWKIRHQKRSLSWDRWEFPSGERARRSPRGDVRGRSNPELESPTLSYHVTTAMTTHVIITMTTWFPCLCECVRSVSTPNSLFAALTANRTIFRSRYIWCTATCHTAHSSIMTVLLSSYHYNTPWTIPVFTVCLCVCLCVCRVPGIFVMFDDVTLHPNEADEILFKYSDFPQHAALFLRMTRCYVNYAAIT